MDSRAIFAVGMIGALAPEIVRLYSIRTHPARFRWSWFYIVISILFGALGGLLAIALPATTYWGAIYIGISTPVVVNQVLKKTTGEKTEELKSPPVTAAAAAPSLRSFLNGI